MRDYIDIGATPPDEPCEQMGPNYSRSKAMQECKRYIALLREKFGPEPDGAALTIKACAHDFGTYHEVVCYFTTDDRESIAYAFACEGSGPSTWDDVAPFDWRKEYLTVKVDETPTLRPYIERDFNG